MHELSVTQSILEIALRHAGEAGAKRITDIYLVIGELSTNVDESVQFYWDMIAKGTIAEGAELHFERVAARMRCLDCNQEYSPSEDLFCPACQSGRIMVIAGDEFRLDAIDVE